VERQAGGDPKPWSAYRLGYLSRTFPSSRRLFLEKPEYEWKTAKGVFGLVVELNSVVAALSEHIPVNIHREIESWIAEQTKLCSAVCEMVHRFHDSGKGWNLRLVESTQRQERLDIDTLTDFIA